MAQFSELELHQGEELQDWHPVDLLPQHLVPGMWVERAFVETGE
jgi:hypothetical protein